MPPVRMPKKIFFLSEGYINTLMLSTISVHPMSHTIGLGINRPKDRPNFKRIFSIIMRKICTCLKWKFNKTCLLVFNKKSRIMISSNRSLI